MVITAEPFSTPASRTPAEGTPLKAPAIAGYAARSVLRNRRGAASALLGLVLATAVISAPWIALDSTVRGLVEWYVDGLTMDVWGMGMESELANATRDLAAVPNVQRVEPIVFLYGNANVSGSLVGNSLFLVRPTFGGIADRLGLSWPGSPNPGQVVASDYFQSLGKAVGDPLSFMWESSVYDRNGSLIKIEVRWTNFTISGFYTVVAPERGFTGLTAFLSVDDVPVVTAGANLTYGLPAQTFIWINRGALFDPYDLAGSSARLQRQLFLMQNAAGPYGFYLMYAPSTRGASLDGIASQIDSRTFGLRLIFTAFTVPTLALAGLLARVGFEIGVTGRRRELAVLRARGLSVRAVRAVLFLEATMLAALGGLLGLALGAVLSRLFLSSAMWDATVSIPLGDVAITASTAAFAFLIAWAFALLSSWRLARLLASEDIISAFKAHHAAEVAIPHRASRDFLMAGVASAGILLLIASGSTKGSPLGILSFLLGVSTVILAPVAPFLLTAAVVRYLTRGTTRAYRAISRLFRPILGELQPLVERNLARVPRRSSNIAIVVTFAVGFVVAIFVVHASTLEYQNREILHATPADVVAEWYGFDPYRPPIDLLDEANLTRLRAIPGVASVTPVLITDSDRGTIVLFEASTFLRSVPWLTPADLGGPDPAALMALLDFGDSFAADTTFVNQIGVQPGDTLRFHTLAVNVSLRFVGAVREIPGLSAFGSFGGWPGVTYADVSVLPPSADLSRVNWGRLLIGLSPGADSAFVAREVDDVFPGRLSIRTLDQARAAAARDPGPAAIFSFLEAQTQVAVVMLVVAVALFVYSASAERRDELATLVARGVGTRAVGALVMAEGWVVTILGLALGVLGGIVSSWTILAMADLVNPTTTPVPFVIPATVLIPMAGAVLGVAAAGFVGALSIRGMDVARVLKLRGG